MREFYVETKCGRNMIWSAYDIGHLTRSMIYSGHEPKRILTLEEHEAQEARKYGSLG